MDNVSAILRTETKHPNTNTSQVFITNNCTSNQTTKHEDAFKVPNIVHYIWYADKEVDFRFDRALSVLSAVKNINPDAVYFHTNFPPTGKYFEMLKEIPRFKVTYF